MICKIQSLTVFYNDMEIALILSENKNRILCAKYGDISEMSIWERAEMYINDRRELNEFMIVARGLHNGKEFK